MPKQTKMTAPAPAAAPVPVVLQNDTRSGRLGSLMFLPADKAKILIKAGKVRRATDHDCAIAGFSPSSK